MVELRDHSDSEKVISVNSPWIRQKDFWIRHTATEDSLIRMATAYVRSKPTDAQTVIWILTRGAEGADCGGSWTEHVATTFGGFTPRPVR